VKPAVLYDLTLYLCGVSLCFLLIGYVRRIGSARKFGTGLLIATWLLQIGMLVISVMRYSQEGIYDSTDTLLFFSWLLVTFSLIVSLISKADVFALFVYTAGFCVMAAGMFGGEAGLRPYAGWNGIEDLLLVHIAMAIAGYAAFAIGAVLSGMYLFLHHHLKGKRWTQLIKRFPSLTELEGGARKLTIAGLPLIVASTSLGFVWLAESGQLDLVRDPKVLGSLAIALVYIVYLVLHRIAGISGSKLAKWNLAAFMIVVLNYAVAGGMSAFHRWM